MEIGLKIFPYDCHSKVICKLYADILIRFDEPSPRSNEIGGRWYKVNCLLYLVEYAQFNGFDQIT